MNSRKSIVFNINIVLMILGICLWVLSLDINHYVYFDLNNYLNNYFGLFQEVPYLYLSIIFLSVASLIFCFSNKEKWFLLNILILAMVIYGTPSVLEEYPRKWDAYWHGYTANYILDNGINFSATENNFYQDQTYLQFPSSFIWANFLTKISGIDILTFLRYYPFLVGILTVIFTYALFKKLNNPLAARVSLVFFILINPYVKTHFSPSSIGGILLPLIILIGINELIKGSAENNILLSILLLMLVFAHPITFVVYLIFLVSYVAISKTGWANNKLFILSPFIIFISYMMYLGTGIFNLDVTKFANFFLLMNKAELVNGDLLSKIYFLPVAMRLLIFIISFNIAVIYMIYRKFDLFKTLLFLTGIGTLILNFFLGSLFFDRVLLYMYIPVSLVLGEFFVDKYRSKIINFSKILFVVFLLITVYGYYWDELSSSYSKKDILEYQKAYEFGEGKTIMVGDIYPYNMESPLYLLGLDKRIKGETFINFRRIDSQMRTVDLTMISKRIIFYAKTEEGISDKQIQNANIILSNYYGYAKIYNSDMNTNIYVSV